MSDSANNLNSVTMRRASRNAGLLSKQRGMSFMGVFVIMAVAAFFGLFAFKVGPTYFEFMTVKKIATDLQANTDVLRKPKSKVNDYIGQAYRHNNLWDLKADETIKLSKDSKRGYVVSVDYEKRTNLFANIDVVTVFKHEPSEL